MARDEGMRAQLNHTNIPANVPTDRPRFLNVKEVAELLRIKPRTVYEMVSQRRIPFRKAGDRTIFLLDEILSWTEANSRR
jgi:excisionase family DNA binding protein